MAGQLLLPSAALAAETPETAAGQDAVAMVVAGPVASSAENQATKTQAATVDAASLTTMDAGSAAIPPAVSEAAPAAATVMLADEPAGTPAPTPESVATASVPAAAPATRGATLPGGGEIRINTTVVNHFYDLELTPAFTLIQDEAFVYDFPDAPEGFTPWRNKSVHLFKIDPDTESLVKTEDAKETNVSISIASVDNHERATLVFTGGGADPLISYSLDLLHSIYIGALADFDFSNFNNGEGTILETKHMYYIRCVFDSNVYLIATNTTEPDPDVKPDPETKAESAPQSKAENPAAYPASTKAAMAAEPAKTALPATGDSSAMAVALGAAGAAAAAAVVAARRRNR